MKRKPTPVEPEARIFSKETVESAFDPAVEPMNWGDRPLFGDDGPARDPLVVEAGDANVDRDPILAAIQAEARDRGDLFRGLAEIALEWGLSPVAILTEAIATELRRAGGKDVERRGRRKDLAVLRERALDLEDLETLTRAIRLLIDRRVEDADGAAAVFDEVYRPRPSEFGAHVDELGAILFDEAEENRHELAARALAKARSKQARRDFVAIALELWREDGHPLPAVEDPTPRKIMAALKHAEAQGGKHDEDTGRDRLLRSPSSIEFDRFFEAATKVLRTRSR